MLRFIVQRILISIPSLLLITVIVFGLQKLLPGDIATVIVGDEPDPIALAAIREKYLLDRPIYVQYFHWLGGLLEGDLGDSIRIRTPIGPIILQKLPVTILLALFAMVFSLGIGIPAGIISAIRKGTRWDYAANAVALSGISVPHFWLGIMLILLFAVELRWLPPGGYVSPLEDPLECFLRLLMPAFVLGSGLAATMMRQTRSAMLTVMKQDYIRTARAKGLGERVVILKHALRNALIPVITLGSLQFGALVAGAVLTEQVFTIPGFGRLVVEAIFTRDYAVIQAVTLCTGVGYLLMSLFADICYFLVNPKMRSAAWQQ
jgi:peptide/nickel transport system permease protein